VSGILLALAVSHAASLWGCAATISDKARATARIRYDMGVASLDAHDLRGALRELLQAVQLNPSMAEAHHALALVLHALGREDDALEHYETALRLRPGFSEVHNNYGTLLMAVGRYEEAIEAFKTALSDILYPTPSLAEGNMGWACFKNGDVQGGIRHLRNAVATNPKFCRGYEWLMRVGIDQQLPELVIRSGQRFEKHCAADSELTAGVAPEYFREMRYYLGVGYLKNGDVEAARDSFSRCAGAAREPVFDGDPSFASLCASSLAALP
jgi:type IV pilus biogenesis/stability protein PilW